MSDDYLEDEPKPKNRPRRAELLVIQNTMSNEGGRDFMWRCLQNTGIFSSTFHADPITHSFSAGGREHGLWLERELKEAAPDQYIKMLKEHINE